MERLTEWNGGQTLHAYYPRCFEAPCYGGGCKIKDCPFETAVCERLAAYEDTGLDPEEVLPKDKADEIALKLMRLADLESLCNYTRLRELAEADKDGRVLILPCKVGDTVWALIGYAREPRECKVEFVNIGNGYTTIILRTADDAREQCGVPLPAFGRTVFLTREGAAKAVQDMKGDTEK